MASFPPGDFIPPKFEQFTEEKPKFAPGQIVRLKSGSQRMTVLNEVNGQVNVMWSDYNKHEIKTHTIPVIALVEAS